MQHPATRGVTASGGRGSPRLTRPTFSRFRYVHFAPSALPAGVESYYCLNTRTKDRLGTVYYYRPWHQWIIEIEPDVVMSSGCLRDVAIFLDCLAVAHGQKPRNTPIPTPPPVNQSPS